MSRTRYREERTLVRGFRRLPGEKREDFLAKVQRLRRQFEQFNMDASEVCQWLMGLRPGGKRGSEATEKFWRFFLEPETDSESPEDTDRRRRDLFDFVAGTGDEPNADKAVLDSAKAVSALTPTPTARKLFERLAKLNPGTRQVLLKAAAEWVLARYEKGLENWNKQHTAWEDEEDEWEKKHPELPREIRDQFNNIFKGLGIRLKNPRVCTWERLKDGKDNCEYAGERVRGKHHGPLCARFNEFLKQQEDKQAKGPRFKKELFLEDAREYLELRRKNPKQPPERTLEQFVERKRQARVFRQAWRDYLKTLGISEDKALQHCSFSKDEQECEYNPHTNECAEYRRRLLEQPDLQSLDEPYREWRKEYLAGPSKHSFRYPSARDLPMPKIFGRGFFEADFEKSQVGLRLEDMREGDFMRFAFKPWPQDYNPQPQDAEITSVHVHFVGTRPRLGFRFSVTHAKSRFGVTQDEIDDLRSKNYPRAKQDKDFLDDARKRLLASFPGNAETDLKLMAVDLGTDGAGAVVLKGKNVIHVEPLKIIKIEKLLTAKELHEEATKDGKVDKDKLKNLKEKGLGSVHVGKHLDRREDEAKKISKKRGKEKARLRSHDLRRLGLHTQWMIRDWARLNASQIIQAAENHGVDLIVFESLRGFKAKGYEKLEQEEKRRLAFFAYGRVRRKVKEKAVERGMRVVTVPYLESSQHCWSCGKKQEDLRKLRENKKIRRFKCEFCSNKCDSDVNAAGVLAKVFWGDIVLPTEETRRRGKT